MRISALSRAICAGTFLLLSGEAFSQSRFEHLQGFEALPHTQSNKILGYDTGEFSNLKDNWLSKPLSDQELLTLGKGWVATGDPSSTQTANGIEIVKQLSGKGVPAASLTLGLWGADPALAPAVGDARSYFEKAAKDGDPVAAQALGRSLLLNGGKVEGLDGFRWLERSVQAGNVAAKPDLAAAYEFGMGTTPDISKSETLFRAAADTGQAPYALAYAEFKVRNGAAYTDDDVAKLLKTSAEGGDFTAKFFLADQALKQGSASAAEATKALNDLADADDDRAMVRLGELAEHSNTGQPDLAKAQFWLRKAAEKGNIAAKGQLGSLYLKRFSDQPDKVALGQQLLESAANAGNPSSMIELAYSERSPKADLITRYSYALTGLELSSGRELETFREYSIQACNPASADVRCEAMPIFYFTNRKKDTLPDGGETYENILAPDAAMTKGISLAIAPTMKVSQSDGGAQPTWGEIAIRGLREMRGVSDLISWFNGKEEILRQQPNTKFEIHSRPDSSELSAFVKSIHNFADKTRRTKVFVYVHGFANSFDSAIGRMALLSEQYNAPGVPVVFSWASANTQVVDLSATYSGNLGIGYVNDMRMAKRSCDSFQKVLAALVREFGSGNVMVLAHSMGGEMVVDMLTSCAKGSSWDENLKLGQLIFAAPDVDQDEFKEAAALLVKRAKSTALYASQNDVALAISAKLGEPGTRRAGQGGSGLLVEPPVQSIDASRVEGLGGDQINHGYVFDVRQVRTDVVAVLRDTPLDQRDCITDQNGRRDPPGTVVGADPNEYWIVQANCQ